MKLPTVLGVLFSALLWLVSGAAVGAQQGPSGKVLQIIVPYSAGSVADSLARLIAPDLGISIHQPVIVLNKPAGGAVAAAEAFTRAEADGSRLLLVTSSHVFPSPALAPSYDPLRDFAPVTTIASNEFVLVAHPSVPAGNLKELISLAKAEPDRLSYGSAGEMSASHLAGGLFNALAGVSIRHVPYKGAAPALTDLLGGHLDLSYQGPLAVLPHVQNGKLKPLGYGGEQRSVVLPAVPTFAEGGVANYHLKIWFGFLAPSSTPPEVVNGLSTAIRKILEKPGIQQQLVGQGMEPFPNSPAQFAALLKADKDKFDALITSADIKLSK